MIMQIFIIIIFFHRQFYYEVIMGNAVCIYHKYYRQFLQMQHMTGCTPTTWRVNSRGCSVGKPTVGSQFLFDWFNFGQNVCLLAPVAPLLYFWQSSCSVIVCCSIKLCSLVTMVTVAKSTGEWMYGNVSNRWINIGFDLSLCWNVHLSGWVEMGCIWLLITTLVCIQFSEGRGRNLSAQ